MGGFQEGFVLGDHIWKCATDPELRIKRHIFSQIVNCVIEKVSSMQRPEKEQFLKVLTEIEPEIRPIMGIGASIM